jgi:hypothetical protein
MTRLTRVPPTGPSERGSKLAGHEGVEMATTIENLTHRKVLVRLSSGETLHLGPRVTSPELTDVEVKNDKVRKLEGQHIIALHSAGEAATPRKRRTPES